MGDSDDKTDDVDAHTCGTVPRDQPITRADFERAVRGLNTADLMVRDQLLHLAARVVALTDEVTRRLDGVEPKPAPPNTPAEPPITTVENMVALTTDDHLYKVRANDAYHDNGVAYDLVGESKYDAVVESPPCEELIPICHGRCCRLRFALSTEDLDEGVVRWDYGRPYLIRQRESDGRCVHNDPETKFCTVHAVRPRVCRVYHCKDDPRIWTDYEKRIPAPDPNTFTKE
ncbi:MAG: YkgJ family cysteine cluster protein, partial [Polyangiales bacterium]